MNFKELFPKEFGRIAAQSARQMITQKIREESREIIFDEFKDKKNELITGLVQKADGGALVLDLGRIEGIMPKKEQVPTEKYELNDKLKAVIVDVKKGLNKNINSIVTKPLIKKYTNTLILNIFSCIK